jgi:hypothetical protein
MDKQIHAAAHPGRLGDVLYCLPLLRYLSKRDNVLFDFYTSEYCLPLKELFEYQDCINQFYVAEDYVLDNFGCGGQPWYVPVPNEYEKVYQLGFKRTPDTMLHQFIAAEQGIYEPLAIEYQYPEYDLPLPKGYICIAPRGNTSFNYLFDDIPNYTPSVIIGGENDYRGIGFDYTGKSFLETLCILSKSKGFVGLMSSQLVLANGFPIKRIAPHDGQSWDLSHAVHYWLNHYPINPNVMQVVSLLRG